MRAPDAERRRLLRLGLAALGTPFVAGPLLGAWLPRLAGASPQGASATPDSLQLKFAWNRFHALHCWLRVMAERQSDPPAAFSAAIETYRKHRKLIPDPRIWYTMESYIARVRTPEALPGQLATFPLEYRQYDLAPTGRAIATAMQESLGPFEATIWPPFETIKSTDTEPTLRGILEPRRKALLEFMFTSLNTGPFPDPLLEFNLVGVYALRGLETREINGRHFATLEIDRFRGLDLIEGILFLVGRSIEQEDAGNLKGALAQIRLKQSVLRLPNPALLPQAVLYWTAGEAVRRVVDPQHEHTGQKQARIYGAFRPFMSGLREVWNPYLDGKLGLAEAVDRLIARIQKEG